MRWNPAILEGWMGPGATDLIDVDVPDASVIDPQSAHWSANYALNSLLRARWNTPMHELVSLLLYRAEGAFVAHDLARRQTMDLIVDDQISVRRYRVALAHWETFLARSAQAIGVFQSRIGSPGWRKGL